MKLVFALACLLSSLVWAQWTPHSRDASGRHEAVAPSGCATTDTALPHDEFLEGWQVTDGENTWNFTDGGSDIVLDRNSDTTALTTGKPTGACDRAIKIVADLADVTAGYYRWNRGSAITAGTDIDFYFSIYIPTGGGMQTAENLGIISFGAGTTPATSKRVYCNLILAAGATKIYANGATSSSYVDSASNLSLDAWHNIKIHTDVAADAAGSYIQIDGGTAKTFQRGPNNFQYTFIGAVDSLTIGDSTTNWVDVIAINTP